jgi:hypothetical protein
LVQRQAGAVQVNEPVGLRGQIKRAEKTDMESVPMHVVVSKASNGRRSGLWLKDAAV